MSETKHSTTTPVYRLEDNELMGLIRQHPDRETLWRPLTIFNYPLADFMQKDEAIRYLQSHGLEVLLDNWQFYDEADGEWYKCAIVEAKPDLLTIKISDYGHPDVHQMLTIMRPDERKIRHR